jgi:predicted DNA-binding protein
MLFVDGGNNVIGIGTSSIDTNAQVHIEGPQEYLVMKHAGQMGIKLYGDDTNVIYSYDKTADSLTGGIAWSHADGTTLFYTNGSNERMRIQSDGTLLVGKTSSGITNVGVEAASDKLSATVASANVCYFNRETNDGSVVIIYGDGNDEGGIGVSGNTVQFNGFTGSHWSRLADNSKPTILRGTIMESIDEMCDWYQAVADVAEVNYTAEDQEVIDGDKNVGDVKTEAYKVKESIALGDKSIGDAITFTSNGTEYTGTIVKEDDVKHNKCKVSDTADSKKIYGLFSNWDDADDGLDGDVNDMNIVQVGTYIIRVNKDVTVEAGDLLVSNGDGTAKVQDDDIIRSKTVAKVNSNIKVETYSDGSYTVPCTLHC